MSAPQVNGDVPPSAFFDHLLNYPVIADGVNTVKQNKFGQRGIALGDSAYQTFAKPVFPYLEKPYQYVSPYVRKVDDLGDKTLSQIDQRFPAVKKPTGELYEDTKSLVLLPYRIGLEQKDHVVSVFTGERKKAGGDSIVPTGKALLSTALIVTSETLHWASGLISSGKQKVQQHSNNGVSN